MKVAMVGRYFNRQGGVSRWLSECADRGARDGDATVFTHYLEDVGQCGAQIERCWMLPSPHWLQRPTFSLAVRTRLALRRNEFDLVHVHDPQCVGGDVYTAHSCFSAHVIGRREETEGWRALCSRAWAPHVVGMYRERVAYTARHRRDRLPLVAAVSEQVRRELESIVGVPPANLCVVHPGVDTEQFRPLRDRAAARRDAFPECDTRDVMLLVFVGYRFGHKGLAFLLHAIAELPGLPIQLLVLGGDDRAPFQRTAERLGLAERVRFTGHVARPEQFIAMADALVLPSIYEAFPLVVMEALACGTPVIASKESNAGEVITGGETTGTIYGPARDTAGLARALAAFHARRSSWPAMRAHARALAEARTWDDAWRDTVSVYREARLRLPGAGQGR